MSRKKKFLRILFWLSFVPYLLLVGYSAYFAIVGYDVYTLILPQYLRTIYGWDAFCRVFVWTGIAFCIIPILPICLLYQLIYFMIALVSRSTVKRY